MNDESGKFRRTLAMAPLYFADVPMHAFLNGTNETTYIFFATLGLQINPTIGKIGYKTCNIIFISNL